MKFIKLFFVLSIINLTLSLHFAFGQNNTVTFSANGGRGTPPSSQTIPVGTGITLPRPGNIVGEVDFTVFGGWNTNSDGTGINYNAGSAFMPTGNVTLYARWNPLTRFRDKTDWLHQNAQSGRSYVIDVIENVTLNSGRGTGGFENFSYNNKNNITVTLRGVGTNRIINLSSLGSTTLISVGSGVTLILDNNITLQGNNTGSTLVSIITGGTFIMNDGSSIIGN